MDVEITRHSTERIKSRVGISKKIAEKNAQKAFECGITHAETKGGLHRYIDKLFFSHKANNIKIYHRYVYIFYDNKLVTVFLLPSKYNDVADKLQRQKEQNNETVKDTTN